MKTHSSNTRVWLSARTGEGVDLLLDNIDQHLSAERSYHCLKVPATAGQFRSKLFDLGAVRSEDVDEQGTWVMEVELEDYRLNKLCEEAKLDVSELQSGHAHY
jgi:GTP-binding protein HflX